MLEDVHLEGDTDPAERVSLRLVVGHQESDADGELPPLELQGALVLRNEHLDDDNEISVFIMFIRSNA